MDAHDPLALEEQVCFALAVASRSVISAYRPVLEPLGLTHPQYLVMLALWQHDRVSVKRLGELLHLEPATLSPLLKRLETAGLLERLRASYDERSLDITLTTRGMEMRVEALKVPPAMLATFGMTIDDLRRTNMMLHDIIDAATAATS